MMGRFRQKLKDEKKAKPGTWPSVNQNLVSQLPDHFLFHQES